MRNLFIFVVLLGFSCTDTAPLADLPLQKPLYFSFKNPNILKTMSGDSFVAYDSLFSYKLNGIETFFTGYIWKNPQHKDSMSFISSRVSDIVYLSSVKEIKTFYLHLPKLKADTLFADYFEIINNPKGQNSCNCDMPLRELKFNGKSCIRKTNYTSNGIYIFDR